MKRTAQNPLAGTFPVTLADIQTAKERISSIVLETPLHRSVALSSTLGRAIYLKLETAHDIGSFKIRGAANAMLSMSPTQRRSGVITMSSGNHGRAVSYVARILDIPATVLVTELVPESKVAAIEQFGAEVIVQGSDQNESTERAKELAVQRGMSYVSAYDDLAVIAGQGTVALELLQRQPDLDSLVVQVSGGGLMSGVAIAAKSIKPDIVLIGVTNDRGAAMYESVKAGRIVEVEEVESLADALQGGLPLDNKYTFSICQHLVDKFCLVSDKQIEHAIAHCFYEEKQIVEGAGAAAVTLLLENHELPLGNSVAAICSGNNIAMHRFTDIVCKYKDDFGQGKRTNRCI